MLGSKRRALYVVLDRRSEKHRSRRTRKLFDRSLTKKKGRILGCAQPKFLGIATQRCSEGTHERRPDMRTLFTKPVIVVAVPLALALSSVSAALASTSWQGSDYSFNYSTTYIQTCDQESDSTKVKSIGDNNGSGGGDNVAYDNDGNNGTCGSANAGWAIWRHRTCEYRAAWPDQCGNWMAV